MTWFSVSIATQHFLIAWKSIIDWMFYITSVYLIFLIWGLSRIPIFVRYKPTYVPFLWQSFWVLLVHLRILFSHYIVLYYTGKILIIGGGIANFTNVAATFKGIVRALKERKTALQQHRVRLFVRRAGPNYQEGLRIMRELGEFPYFMPSTIWDHSLF